MVKDKLINLLGFLLNILIVLFTIFSITKYFNITGKETVENLGVGCFRYYTILSNIYLALISLISLAINVYNFLGGENIKTPNWLSKLRLTGVSVISITFFTVLLFLLPFHYSDVLFDECGIFLHLINPLLAFINFLVAEEYYDYKIKDNIFSMIPLFLYGVCYITFNLTGIWDDFYSFNVKKTWPLVIIIFAIGSFTTSYLFSLISKKTRKLIANIKSNKNEFFTVGDDYDFSLNAFDAYCNKISTTVLNISLVVALCAAATLTFLKFNGWLTIASWTRVIIFDVCNLSYIVIAGIFLHRAKDENGIFQTKYVKVEKIILVVLITFQWNFITYLFPLRDFWGFAFLFVILTAFFFDYRLVDVLSTFLLISITISWFYKGAYLLPKVDNQYYANFVFRIVCLAISLVCLHLICFFGGKFLVDQLEKFTDHDPLTTLFNRRKLPIYYDKMRKVEKGFNIAILDIDDFKKFNDNYGHEIGDEVLKNISKTILSHISASEVAFRYGGEELLLFISKNKEETIEFLNALMEKIRNIKVPYKDETLNVTVTMGVATYSKENSFEELFNIADNNLYIGKNSGKNKIVF